MKWKPAHSAAENARTMLPKMARKYFEAGRKAIAGNRPADELHRFRLKTKRFRYTLELFRPLYGVGMDRYLKALRELQGALGKVSDYQAIRRVLADDKELKKQIDNTVRGKLKDLRRSWRAFDSPGQLKRWRIYLAGGSSKTTAKRAIAGRSAQGPVVQKQTAQKRTTRKETTQKQTIKKPPTVAEKKVLAQAAG